MANALDVLGELMVEIGDSSVRVEARGDTIVVELPSLRAGYAILRRSPGGRGRGRTIRRVHDGLAGAGLRLEVRVGPSTIGVMGLGARSGLISRLLGVAPMEVQVGGLLAARRQARGLSGVSDARSRTSRS